MADIIRMPSKSEVEVISYETLSRLPTKRLYEWWLRTRQIIGNYQDLLEKEQEYRQHCPGIVEKNPELFNNADRYKRKIEIHEQNSDLARRLLDQRSDLAKAKHWFRNGGKRLIRLKAKLRRLEIPVYKLKLEIAEIEERLERRKDDD